MQPCHTASPGEAVMGGEAAQVQHAAAGPQSGGDEAPSPGPSPPCLPSPAPPPSLLLASSACTLAQASLAALLSTWPLEMPLALPSTSPRYKTSTFHRLRCGRGSRVEGNIGHWGQAVGACGYASDVASHTEGRGMDAAG